MEHEFNEIHNIQFIIDNTLKQLSEKNPDLSNMKSQVLESVQPMMSESLNAHGRKISEHLGNTESKFKHLNCSLDSLHVKSNVFDTHIKKMWNCNHNNPH